MSTSTPTTTTAGGSGGGGGLPSITTNYFVGLGYAVTVGLGLLGLLSTIVLASYICCRPSRERRNQQNLNNATSTSNNGVILPRGIFVADDDDNAAVGIDPAVINSYPKFWFSKDHGGGVNDSTCSICLCEYGDAEMLRMLPDCRHHFHLTCVDAWLKLNASCPVCRNSPLPTPLSTPLSEVGPLSQYSDDRRRW